MKVILIKNAVETLGYFSEQLAETFQEMGHDTYFVDYDDLVNTVDGISRFAVPEKTVLCTFNFIGLSGEEVFIEENGRYIWENQGIACINILVDHPLYYHSKLAKPPVPEMRVFCIDRERTVCYYSSRHIRQTKFRKASEAGRHTSVYPAKATGKEDGIMFNVIKRDGEVAAFQLSKITQAIEKAFQAQEKQYTPDMMEMLGLRVTADFQKKIKKDQVSVEDIQDSVENVLIQCGYSEVAKAYILYRKQREKVRNMKSTILDYKEIVNSYVKVEDWRVKENSTVTYSVGGLILSNSGAVSANYWLSEIYD